MVDDKASALNLLHAEMVEAQVAIERLLEQGGGFNHPLNYPTAGVA